MGRAIVDHLFPEGDAGRIPIVGVTGTNGKTVVARLIARLLYLSGKRTGLACSEGLYLDRRLVQKGDRADFASGTRVLMNRNVDAAVIENDSSVILGQGPGLRPLPGRRGHQHRRRRPPRRFRHQ